MNLGWTHSSVPVCFDDAVFLWTRKFSEGKKDCNIMPCLKCVMSSAPQKDAVSDLEPSWDTGIHTVSSLWT